MTRQAKMARGELRNPINGEHLTRGDLKIVLVDEQPRYAATLTVAGYHPELDGRKHWLDLGHDIEGEVFLSIAEFPETSRTVFAVVLSDPAWDDIDWFNVL
ncbi:MAG: hypothetical protein ACE5F6_21570 [Anaerolineae bacterium]